MQSRSAKREIASFLNDVVVMLRQKHIYTSFSSLNISSGCFNTPKPLRDLQRHYLAGFFGSRGARTRQSILRGG
jgi:hypothetical protein